MFETLDVATYRQKKRNPVFTASLFSLVTTPLLVCGKDVAVFALFNCYAFGDEDVMKRFVF